MPTVLRIGSLRFFFFSRENNEPAHVHIAASGKEAKVWLEPVQLAYSFGFKPYELRQLIGLTKENKDFLLEAWNEYFNRIA